MKGIKKEGVLADEIKTLYKRSLLSIPINYATCLVVAAVFFLVVDTKPLLMWVLTVFVLTTVRTIHVYWSIKNADFERYATNYRNIYCLGAMLAGLLWMIIFFMFAFEVPEVYMLFIIFTLGGMAIGAASSMATSPACYFSYMTPMILPPAVIFIFEADIFGFAMSFLMLLLFIMLFVSFMQGYRTYQKSLSLKGEKDNLINSLKNSNKELEDAYEKIMNLSNTDELTSLSNRRSFDIGLKKEWGRALRSNLCLSFIMVDIDFFKGYNDSFGHQEGDKCLQAIAHKIAELVKRPGDMVARYGGEEFCLVLPDTDTEGATVLANKIKEEVEGLKIRAANTSVSPYVTISLGISSITPTGKIIAEDLIYAADKALYLAKQHGRNRIETWEADV